ncbi:MAG: RidA family protein [Acetobacteraceae bacterium]
MARFLTARGAASATWAYSHAAIAAGLVFTAGVGPLDPDTDEVVGHDPATQTAQALANITAILDTAGLGLADVVKVTVYLQDVARDFEPFDQEYRRHFADPWPVRTTVGADLLGILVEIDVVAQLRPDARVPQPENDQQGDTSDR